MNRVKNLATGSEHFYTCDPRSAVISAYAQSRNDGNTWDYESRYGHLVMTGRHSYNLGDWCCLFDGR